LLQNFSLVVGKDLDFDLLRVSTEGVEEKETKEMKIEQH